MTNLVTAYQNNDINDFEKILKVNRQTIMEDTFIREHIEDLLKNIRTQVRTRIFFVVLSFNLLWGKWSVFGKEKEVNCIINGVNFLLTASFWAKTLPRLCLVAEDEEKRVSKVACSLFIYFGEFILQFLPTLLNTVKFLHFLLLLKDLFNRK